MQEGAEEALDKGINSKKRGEDFVRYIPLERAGGTSWDGSRL